MSPEAARKLKDMELEQLLQSRREQILALARQNGACDVRIQELNCFAKL